MWLDRGELDKLIAREAGVAADPVVASRGRPRDRDDDDDDDDRRFGQLGGLGGHKRKKKSFLSEIFEFGD